MNTENSKTNKPHKFVLHQLQRLGLRSLNEYVAHQSLSIYYKWKNIRKQYKNIKLIKIGLTWNDEFELPNVSYSVSDIQDYIEYIIKQHETLTNVPPIQHE